MPQLDHFVTLGRSGLRVSPLCLGAMTFGEDWGFGSPVEDSLAVIDAYRDAGGNFIDTANIYTKGHSERILGDHLCSRPSVRDSMVIATKWVGNMYPGDPNGGGAHRKSLYSAVEHSLRRLQTDYIDLLWMHFWDDHTPIEETMRALDDLVRAGKLRYIGFTDTPAWKCTQAQMLAQFHAMSPVIAIQLEYSLAERTSEADLIPMAKEMGMGVTPWSPLKGGLLTGKYGRDKRPSEGDAKRADWLEKHLSNERTLNLLDTLDEIAKETERTQAEVALAWCRQQSGIDSTIIGARTLDQLKANLNSISLTLSDAHLSRLNDDSKPDLPFPHPFLEFVRTTIQNDTTINGITRDSWPLSPKNDDERW